MRLRRAITWGAASTVLVIVLTAGGLYLAAKRVPGDYRPQTLSEPQRRLAKRSMENALLDLLELTGRVGARDARTPWAEQPREGTLELTADELNRWVATLGPEAHAALREMGLRDPAIGIGDGRLSLYAYWDAHNMVVGLDLAPIFDADQNMTIDVKGVRLGALPVPNRMFDEYREQIMAQLREHTGQLAARRREKFGRLPMDDLGRAGKLLVDAAEGIPVRLDFPRRRGHARVSDIRLEPGKATLDVISLLQPPDQD